jgi:hypothetical protein
MTGLSIVPDGSASCLFFGDHGATTKFSAPLIPEETYTLACKSNHNASVDVVTVAVSTTQGTYMTYLYNQPPAPLLSQLQSQVTLQQGQLSNLQTASQSQVAQIQQQLTVMKAQSIPMKRTVLSTVESGTFVTTLTPSVLYLKVPTSQLIYNA